MTEPSQKALLPCPWCGGPAKFVPDSGHKDCWVNCAGSCDCTPDQCFGLTGRDDDKVIEAWNTRAATPDAESVGRFRAAHFRECAEIANQAYRTYNEPSTWDYGAQDACTKIEREILKALTNSSGGSAG